ncbi:MAG TPA: hypothetical protein VF633_02260 [Brevundimonas sp.]|jgi:hypothetical protein
MRQLWPFTASIAALILATGACSREPSSDAASVPGSPETTAPAAPAIQPTPVSVPEAAPATDASSKVLALEGLGALRIGQPVPNGGSWASRGAQISDACRTVTSPDYPGIYAIVTDGEVRRITVGQRSDIKLIDGIGVGATEQAVNGAFPGFRSEPHQYEAAPAKYLTAPNAASGDPALRFEIGADGKVSLMHVGTMPVLGYVEGCS